MAKGKITAQCKHCGEYFTIERTFYNRYEADNWEKCYENYYDCCSKCYKEQKRKKEEEAAAKITKECGYNLPELEGSAKQVAWANKIRADFIKNENWAIKIVKRWNEETKKKKMVDIKKNLEVSWKCRVAEMALKIETEESAAWWIDHRNYL